MGQRESDSWLTVFTASGDGFSCSTPTDTDQLGHLPPGKESLQRAQSRRVCVYTRLQPLSVGRSGGKEDIQTERGKNKPPTQHKQQRPPPHSPPSGPLANINSVGVQGNSARHLHPHTPHPAHHWAPSQSSPWSQLSHQTRSFKTDLKTTQQGPREPLQGLRKTEGGRKGAGAKGWGGQGSPQHPPPEDSMATSKV